VSSPFWKRLERLESVIRFRTPRWMVILTNGSNPDEAAEAAILDELGATDEEVVIFAKRFVDTEDLPRVHSVSQP
jgi:hypothetical protein